jgi:hypothetical protein
MHDVQKNEQSSGNRLSPIFARSVPDKSRLKTKGQGFLKRDIMMIKMTMTAQQIPR